MKILFLLAVACFACKLVLGRWPWAFLRAQPKRQQAALRARNLLGVAADATRQDILEAHRRLVVIVHPDKGGTDAQVHEANTARDLLLDALPSER
jgi:hypothetical protein